MDNIYHNKYKRTAVSILMILTLGVFLTAIIIACGKPPEIGAGEGAVVTEEDHYFIAVSSDTGAVATKDGKTAFSKDGVDWYMFDDLSGHKFGGICYANGMFVAVTRRDPTNKAAYSMDGFNWYFAEMPTVEGFDDYEWYEWNSVCYGNDRFVAVGYLKSGETLAAYSDDGKTWKKTQIAGEDKYWRSVCYGGDEFVAVASIWNSSPSYAAHSKNGKDWEMARITPEGESGGLYAAVCYGNGRFVATASEHQWVAYSDNKGSSWTEKKLSESFSSYIDPLSICYGGEKFVALLGPGHGCREIIYSETGENWTLPIDMEYDGSEQGWISICYGNDRFVAVAQSSNQAAYSADGIKWKLSNIMKDADGNDSEREPWYSVCYGRIDTDILQERIERLYASSNRKPGVSFLAYIKKWFREAVSS